MQRMAFERALLPDGWADNVVVETEAGRIVSVKTAASTSGEVFRGVALPALGNLHSHAFQRAMAGLAERRGPQEDDFWTWRETMYRFALTMTPDDVEAVAAQLYLEMLETGFTRVGEFHYLHHQEDGSPYGDVAEMAGRIAAAAAEAGIGLTLLPVFYAHATFGGAPPNAGQRRFIADIDLFARLVEGSRRAIADLPRASLGVAPHSLRALTPEELSNVVALADGMPIHIHVAEQMKEVEDCLAWSGARPVEWLLGHAEVDSRWCLIHATHMSEAETRAMARSGATVGLCPVTEANLGDGIFNGPLFVEAGGRYGIGTDSNIAVSASGELRQLEYAQRLGRRQRNVMAASEGSTGRALLEAALEGGTAALGAEPAGITEGASADIITLDPNHRALADRSGDGLIDSWIFSAGNEAIDCVLARGELLVSGGKHLRREAIRRRFDAAMRRLTA